MGLVREEFRLAIQGGRPVRETMLPYGRQWIEEDDIDAVVEVLRSDWITTGPKVSEFEEAFAARVGARYAVSYSSGTAALHGAVFALDIGSGDEAITAPLTFCATANCVLYQGGSVRFADVSADTLNIDPLEVLRHITPKTRTILSVDYAGHPAELDLLLELAERHGLALIEDACHALGAEYKGRSVGSISHMTVFSFHPVKHITTGEGGMVTTNDSKLAERLRIFRNHGLDSDARERQARGQWHYDMVALGYNYRLSDIGCALGLSQLRKLDSNLARRRALAAHYGASLRDLAGVIPPAVRPGVNPAWHFYPIRLDLSRLGAGRAEILRALRAEGVGVNVHYIPVHLHPYYRQRFGTGPGLCPVAEGAYEALITLPLFAQMSTGDADDVVAALEKVIRHYAK